MFYHIEISFYRVRKDWRGNEKEYFVTSKGTTTHESHKATWFAKQIEEIERLDPHSTYHYYTNESPAKLSVRGAFNLYPEDFKLWCAENGFTNMLDAFRDAVK